MRDNEQPRELVQDLRFDPGQELGNFAVVSWAYTQDAGVEYRFAQKNETVLAVKATVRLYASHQMALDDTLLKYGTGYMERPKRGHHQGKADIGDFSLFTKRTLTFVRRNVRVDLVAANAGDEDLTRLGRAISEEVDRRAALWGQKVIDTSSVKVTFERVPQTNAEGEVVISLTVPAGTEHTWRVLSSVGRVDVGEKRAVVRVGEGKGRPDIRVIVTTRSGFVLEQGSSE